MFEVVSRDEDAETYVGRLFGEEDFTFSTDVNGWLLIQAGSGRTKDFTDLIWSLIQVEAGEDETPEEARRREMDRFDSLLRSRKHFSVEDLMELVNEFTEAAGNDR